VYNTVDGRQVYLGVPGHGLESGGPMPSGMLHKIALRCVGRSRCKLDRPRSCCSICLDSTCLRPFIVRGAMT
jgi:hypothetical protein